MPELTMPKLLPFGACQFTLATPVVGGYVHRVTAVLLRPNPTPMRITLVFDSGLASGDPRSEVCMVAQTKPKSDFW